MSNIFIKNKKIFLIIILFVHIFVSWNVWKTEISNLQDKSYLLFLSEVDDESKSIENKLEVYADTLYSVRGLFAQNEEKPINKNYWDLYIDSLRTFDRYPGITDIYFVKYVKNSELESYIQAKKTEYSNTVTNFSINNFPKKPEYYIIDLVYPFANNSSKIATDIISDSSLSNELNNARDNGVPTTTAINHFAKDILDKPQINILLPVYKKFSKIDSVEERRESLSGFVTMSLTVDQLIENVFKSGTVISKQVDLEIHDITTASSRSTENLIYKSNELISQKQGFFEKELDMTFGGRNWSVRFSAPDTFQRNQEDINYINISFILMLLSGFLLIYIAYQFTERN